MKHTIKGFVTYTPSHPEPLISWTPYDPRKSTYSRDTTVVSETEITVEVPDNYDPRKGMITNREAEMKNARADFEAHVTRLKREISELQALEFTA